ncbi:hypothetical protein AB0M22_17465 [Nocardia sp. NPDC051756]|uniref:hypothetical protein n=1 Tax=Nocardia sp. NPDC051756 TaxID=3154751 RepID=UPI003419CE6C
MTSKFTDQWYQDSLTAIYAAMFVVQAGISTGLHSQLPSGTVWVLVEYVVAQGIAAVAHVRSLSITAEASVALVSFILTNSIVTTTIDLILSQVI